MQSERLVLTTAGSGASCGYDFRKGKEYVLYANGSEESLQASMCSRTQLLADAYDDRAYLGEGYAPLPGQPTVAREPGHSFLLLLGIWAAVVAAVVLFTLRKGRQE